MSSIDNISKHSSQEKKLESHSSKKPESKRLESYTAQKQKNKHPESHSVKKPELKKAGSSREKKGEKKSLQEIQKQRLENTKRRIAELKKTINPDPKAPIKLMGVLPEASVQYYITLIGKSFPSITRAQIIALIQRESAGDPTAKSSTGAKGIMQLTTVPFSDMHKDGGKGNGIGISGYLDTFKKVSPELIQAVRGKDPEFAQTIVNIQGLQPNNQTVFSEYVQKLQDLTSRSVNRGEVELNLLMGSIYLSSLYGRATKTLDKLEFKVVMNKLKQVQLDGVNLMLMEKGFAPVTKGELDAYIRSIVKNERNLGNKFMTNYRYNGDTSRDTDKSEHRIKFGIVACLSEDQLRNKNRA